MQDLVLSSKTKIFTPNLDETRDFYERIFGMVRVEEWDCSVRGRFVAQREQPAIIMRPRVTCQSVSLFSERAVLLSKELFHYGLQHTGAKTGQIKCIVIW